MNKLVFDIKLIKEYQQNRDPYLLIDYATEVVPGVSAKGYKFLKKMNGFLKFIGQKIQICQECFR